MPVQILVCYKSQNINITLPADATFDELKSELFLKTGIHPSLQEISTSSNGNQDIERDINMENKVLWLRSAHTQESNCDNITTDSHNVLAEISRLAASSFIYYLLREYGDDYLKTLKDYSLAEALQKSCLAPLALRKPLVLYLHHEEDAFAGDFCPLLIDGNIRKILERSFLVIGWDLLSVDISTLEDVLDQWTELHYVKTYVRQKQAALFILLPFEDSFFIYASFDGNDAEISHIETVLGEIQNSLVCDTKQDSLKDNEADCLRHQQFHQIMFNRLGDRDYDSFDADEHTQLIEKIGFAKFGYPQEAGYDDKQKEDIKKTFDVIRKHSNKFSEWEDYIVVSFIYNCIQPINESNWLNVIALPLFVIRKCSDSLNPCRVFVDHDDRVYSSWEDYKNTNKLQKCFMILPKNGRYQGNSRGEVQLEQCESPSCSIEHAVLQGADIGFSVAGIGAGAVFVGAAIPAIAAAPAVLTAAAITGIGTGIYGIARSAFKIVDRAEHDETMSIANSEARGAYLNIAAGALSFTGAGTTALMSTLATKGVAVGQAAKTAVNVVNIANTAISAVGIANSTYDIITNFKRTGELSTLSIIQWSTSLLFFGNAVCNFRSANTIIEEAQIKVLREYHESLPSNNVRKMFYKLVKETTRQNGNLQNGRCEVIATLSKYTDHKELFGILSKNYEAFNRAGVRFAAKNGEITLNGVPVNIKEIGLIPLDDLPSIPQTSAFQIKNDSEIFQNILTMENMSLLLKYGQACSGNRPFTDLAALLLQDFVELVKTKIFNIFLAVLRKLNIADVNLAMTGRNYVPHYDSCLFILKIIIQFIKYKINQDESNYQQNKQLQPLPRFLQKRTKRLIYWSEKVVDFFYFGGCINEAVLKELVDYVATKLIQYGLAAIQNKARTEKRALNRQARRKTRCRKCGGNVFSSK